eukprot:TRINITY_DN17632_c1_g1_i1.p1 TRINITY_DN17632_c1_g1~~TRINITY_DN17632_c1_g1_i1.p1  ORF type:complete len:236 (+),score=50.13 TRINITY_DN17632_c1_g1_i1:22-708(+)
MPMADRGGGGGGTTALDLVQGITEHSSRIALKMMFSQFGEVTACWIPPLEHRGNERSYVKFGTTKAAQAAFEASQAGQLLLDGVKLTAEWRMAPARTQDSRDFEARGSNLMTSRDLMRAQFKKGGRDDAGGSRALMQASGGSSRRHDDRDRDRDRDKKKKSRSRSRDRDRDRKKKKKSRSRSRDKSKSRSKSRKRSKEKSKPALEDVKEVVSSDDDDDDDDEGTTAVI